MIQVDVSDIKDIKQLFSCPFALGNTLFQISIEVFYFTEFCFNHFLASQKLCVVLDCGFDLLRLDADVSLRGGGGTVLQQPLHQRDVVIVFVVDLRCIPLAETVGADPFQIQIVAHDFQLLLDGSFSDREDQIVPADAISQAVVFDILLNQERDGEHSALPCLLLHHFQTEAISILYDVARPQLDDVADPQAQVSFQYQRSGNAVIGAATAEPFSHCLDNLLILFCCQRFCFLVHSDLQ